MYVKSYWEFFTIEKWSAHTKGVAKDKGGDPGIPFFLFFHL